MAKVRKTREDKIAASLKRQTMQDQFTYSLNTLTPATITPTIPLEKHLRTKDMHTSFSLKKTGIISLSLLIFELLLFFLLHHQILKLPFAQY